MVRYIVVSIKEILADFNLVVGWYRSAELPNLILIPPNIGLYTVDPS